MLKYESKKIIGLQDWNNLVTHIYQRPYNFQQQDGCQDRQMFALTIPSKDEDENEEDYDNDTVPEIVNGAEMGVSFKAWLERDPKQLLSNRNDIFGLELWWERNFYPNIHTVANDLYKKGLIEAGDYLINIDW